MLLLTEMLKTEIMNTLYNKLRMGQYRHLFIGRCILICCNINIYTVVWTLFSFWMEATKVSVYNSIHQPPLIPQGTAQ